jgi:hypothetical protein
MVVFPNATENGGGPCDCFTVKNVRSIDNGGKGLKTTPYEKGMPMGQAEVIALSEVRASFQWQRLRDDQPKRPLGCFVRLASPPLFELTVCGPQATG